MTDRVIPELDNGVLTVQINRPGKKNALTPDMYAAMTHAIKRAEKDLGIAAVLFTGSGGNFTAGNDMADFMNNRSNDPDRPVNRFLEKISTTDVPLLAAVDGIAIGIGTTLLLHCDQVFATPRATFSMPFVNLGLVPEAGASMQLVNTCGYQKAAELLMLGEPFHADKAVELGIVSTVCTPDALLGRALEFAGKLAQKPARALRDTKRLMRRPPEPLYDRVVAEGELFFDNLNGPAAREIIQAFIEKREPDRSVFTAGANN